MSSRLSFRLSSLTLTRYSQIFCPPPSPAFDYHLQLVNPMTLSQVIPRISCSHMNFYLQWFLPRYLSYIRSKGWEPSSSPPFPFACLSNVDEHPSSGDDCLGTDRDDDRSIGASLCTFDFSRSTKRDLDPELEHQFPDSDSDGLSWQSSLTPPLRYFILTAMAIYLSVMTSLILSSPLVSVILFVCLSGLITCVLIELLVDEIWLD
jgi:hypothetical protein